MITPATDMVPAVDDENPPASTHRDAETFGLDSDLTGGASRRITGRARDPARADNYNSFASCGESAGALRCAYGRVDLSRPPLAHWGARAP